MNRSTVGVKLAAAATLLASAMGAQALPNLQLTIVGGSYVGSGDDTTYASGNPFTLYALMQPSNFNTISDTYKISAAIVPKTGPSAVNYGSFDFNGTTVNVSGDMVYGVPPIDAIGQLFDPGDLADHGIFDTFFKEFSFTFDSTQTTTAFDAQSTTPTGSLTDTDCNISSNSCMYFKAFTIDVASLTSGDVHFDLYNAKLCSGDQGQCGGSTDTDVSQFAPFSHDAQSNGSSSTTSSTSGLASSTSSGQAPEPGSGALALLGLGLVVAGFQVRRNRLSRS